MPIGQNPLDGIPLVLLGQPLDRTRVLQKLVGVSSGGRVCGRMNRWEGWSVRGKVFIWVADESADGRTGARASKPTAGSAAKKTGMRVSEWAGGMSSGPVDRHADGRMDKQAGRPACRWKGRKSTRRMYERMDSLLLGGGGSTRCRKSEWTCGLVGGQVAK